MNILTYASMMGGVLLLDLLLSGDNVLIIGAAAARLARRQRWYAIAIGGVAAMGLRILFTALAAILLNIPFIQTAGAIVLVYLAHKLLRERSQDAEATKEPPATASTLASDKQSVRFNNAFLSALTTILIADITMSLDNIIAVGALSNGELIPLIVGLVGSITVLMLGSAIVSILMERLGWLLDLAALALAWTSATMIHDDLKDLASSQHLGWLLNLSHPTLPLGLSWLQLLLGTGICALVIYFDVYYRLHKR